MRKQYDESVKMSMHAPRMAVRHAKLALHAAEDAHDEIHVICCKKAELERKVCDLRQRNWDLLERHNDAQGREQFLLKGLLKLHELCSNTQGFNAVLRNEEFKAGVEALLRMNTPRTNYQVPSIHKRAVRHEPLPAARSREASTEATP